MLRDSDIIDCINQGNIASAPIDARVYDLAQNWHPSNYFEPAAIRQAVASVQAVLSSAFDALAQAKSNCDLAPGCSFPTWGDRYGDLLAATNQSQAYLQTCDEAESEASAAFQTAYINAPGFKDWAIQSLNAASNAITDSNVSSCMMPWWAAAVVAVVNAVVAAGEVLKRILGVSADVVNTAYQTGKAVVKTAAEAFSLAAWTLGNLPWLIGGALLIYGGIFAWKNRSALKTKLLKRA